jgi:hypothetical protein
MKMGRGQTVAVGFALVVGLAAFATACGGGGGEPLDESEWAARVCVVGQQLEEAALGGMPSPVDTAPGLSFLRALAEAHQRAEEDLASISPPPGVRVYHDALIKDQKELAQAALAAIADLPDSPSEEEIQASWDSYNAVSERIAQDAEAEWDSLPDSTKAALSACKG